jgi:hypothetical protein
MFDKTRDQMTNWRWDNPRSFWDQVDGSNPETTSLGKVKYTGERFSWYGSDDLRAKIKPPSCRLYKPDGFLAVKPLNSEEIIDKAHDDENGMDLGAPSGGSSHPSDGNDIDDTEGEEDTQGAEKRTGKGNSTRDGMGTGKGKAPEEGKGKGKGNCNGKGIVKQAPEGDDTSPEKISIQAEWLCQSERALLAPLVSHRLGITPCPASLQCIVLYITL